MASGVNTGAGGACSCFDEYEPGEEIYAAGVPVEADNDYMFVVIYGQIDLFEVGAFSSTVGFPFPTSPNGLKAKTLHSLCFARLCESLVGRHDVV